jgi:sugar phosphate isomerase/epimerase
VISRREILAMAGAIPFWSVLKSSAPAHGAAGTAQTSPASSEYNRMGATLTAFILQFMAAREGKKPFDMVEHCHGMGLAGVETNPPSMDPQEIKKFRQQLENYNMHLICNLRLPKEKSDIADFEAQVKTYKEAGTSAFRAAMTGRRYEDFDTFEPFKQLFEQCKKSAELAEPVLRKYSLKVGIENHKGWRSGEQAEWLKRLGSEWVGVCLDFGNNISLCEDPLDTARTLAPYACCAHIKDMAVQEYEDGFLLSEVPFGEGIVDLKQIVQMLRKKDPGIIINLEMITRDPLKVPVFTDKYWVTFDDSYSPLPGRDLAKVLKMIKNNPPQKPLPRTTGLSTEEQVRLEDEYNRKCISYARQFLDL